MATREAARHEIPLIASFSDFSGGIVVYLQHYDYVDLSNIEAKYLAEIVIEACERASVTFQPTLDPLVLRLHNPRPKPPRCLSQGRGFQLPPSY